MYVFKHFLIGFIQNKSIQTSAKCFAVTGLKEIKIIVQSSEHILNSNSNCAHNQFLNAKQYVTLQSSFKMEQFYAVFAASLWQVSQNVNYY